MTDNEDQQSTGGVDPRGHSFERRLKRHLWASEHLFFALVNPGFEKICGKELEGAGGTDIALLPGRVECRGKLEVLYQANLTCRTAERLFLVISEFVAVIDEQFVNKCRKIPWEFYFHPDADISVHFFRKHALLKHDDNLERILKRTIKTTFANMAPEYRSQATCFGKNGPQRIHVSLENKHCRISIDSSGEMLHRRGYRLDPGQAPISETLAAGIILKEHWKEKEPFVDGMTGSGTFAIEASLICSNGPTGARRAFAFEAWPSFRRQRWEYVKHQAMITRCECTTTIIANDIDIEQISKARQNARRAETDQLISFRQEDFLSLHGKLLSNKKGFLVLNIPYGKRLSKEKLKSFCYHLGTHLKMHFKGWKVVILFPIAGLESALGIPRASYSTICSGGTKVRYLVARIRPDSTAASVSSTKKHF